MEFITEYGPKILTYITGLVTALITIASFVKSLQTQKKVTNDVIGIEGSVTDKMLALNAVVDNKLKTLDTKVEITRGGIVEAFKNAVVTKDVKVSVNNQVKKILDDKFQVIVDTISKNEEKRTKMMYWVLKILRYTAASDKLTTEQQSEIDEVMAMIADDETIVDTIA
jgi:hypothetical protein